jgi:hypothetical protein
MLGHADAHANLYGFGAFDFIPIVGVRVPLTTNLQPAQLMDLASHDHPSNGKAGISLRFIPAYGPTLAIGCRLAVSRRRTPT